MKTLTYYCKNGLVLDTMIEAFLNAFGKDIKIKREPIEMNYSKVEISTYPLYLHIVEEEFETI